jgi:broad specificity phosphatase PhoE
MPLIHLVRHGESTCDLPKAGLTVDLPLTTAGKLQCLGLGMRLRALGIDRYITHIVSSPNLRAIRSCVLAFGDLVGAGPSHDVIPIRLNADLMETVDVIAWDAPANAETLKRMYGSVVDTSMLEVQDDYVRRPHGRPYQQHERVELASRVREWLRRLAWDYGEAAEIVVMSHAGLLKDILYEDENDSPYDDDVNQDERKDTMFSHAEIRTYAFRDWLGLGHESTKLQHVSKNRIEEWREQWRNGSGSMSA